jgi:2-polyprenyl-3-methyl-5-hydroxy-6-metoxy-1,4-benzoquinol methylase
MKNKSYVGEELNLFAEAKNWKRYYSRLISPFLGKRVLEVGAGIGATTEILSRQGEHETWVCLEPDGLLISEIARKIKVGILPDFCSSVEGNITYFSRENEFDSILYIDVLEHIEHDGIELQNAAALLNQGGHLIVLSPAYDFLFSPFDQSVGHFRRYDKRMIAALLPQLKQVKLIYLDSVGMLTSMANKYILKQDYPTKDQILFWDRWIIPVATVVDRLVFFSFGRSILSVWVKESN